MKSSTALRQAKDRIERRMAIHVCVALSIQACNTDVAYRLEKLFGPNSVADQLHRRGYAKAYDTHSEEMRAYRLRWIDWMIGGYEKVGD